MDYMIYVLYLITALLALEGIGSMFRHRADPARVQARLRRLATRVSESAPADSILRSNRRLRFASLHEIELMLYRAGGPMRLNRFVALSVLLALCGFAGIYSLTGDPFRAIPGILLGGFLYVWVKRLARSRMRAFDGQLPDALELMTRSIRSGHTLVSGLVMVGEELADPIGPEFALVAEEIRLGLELRDALESLMRRIPNEDLPFFSTAILIQRQTGGNLAELLDKLSSLLRERAQFAGRVRALTAQGRGAATFLALWLPFIMCVIWVVAPGYMTPLLENQWGHVTLGSALGLDIVAYVMARRIADVQA